MSITAVFGIGNVLIGDDAVGPTVIHYLSSLWEFPDGVQVEDLGTPSLDLAGRLRGIDSVIFVDAVSAEAPPGTIRVYTAEEILKHPPGLRIGPHDPSLKETLLTSQFAGEGPQHIVLVGVVPARTSSMGLSPEVEAAVPKAAETVLEHLRGLGVEARRSGATEIPQPWWARTRNL